MRNTDKRRKWMCQSQMLERKNRAKRKEPFLPPHAPIDLISCSLFSSVVSFCSPASVCPPPARCVLPSFHSAPQLLSVLLLLVVFFHRFILLLSFSLSSSSPFFFREKLVVQLLVKIIKRYRHRRANRPFLTDLTKTSSLFRFWA